MGSSSTHSILTADGPMVLFEAAPAGAPRGAIIVLMEAFGVNEHIQRVCQRLADEGFLVVAPDLYHRQGKFLRYAYSDQSGVMTMLALMKNEDVVEDLRATLEFLEEMGQSSSSTSVLGFCVGGFCSVLAAIRFPLCSAISFYGAGLLHPREGIGLTPIFDELPRLQAPVLFFFGGRDQSIPASLVTQIQHLLRTTQRPFEAHVYPEAGHGFFCEERPSYRPESAGDAWEKVLDWLAHHHPHDRQTSSLLEERL
jgi:carboxymethylenebutenolidase